MSLRWLAAAAWLAAAGLAGARTYPLASAEPQLASTEPEAALVEAHCSACHSIDYITTQPPGKGRDFWQAEVTKMVTVYGAPVPAEDAARIAAYLGAKR